MEEVKMSPQEYFDIVKKIKAVFHRQKNNNINNAKDNICNIKVVKVE